MKPEKEKSVTEIIAETCDQICKVYCKFPELVRSQVKDIDMAEDLLMKSYCELCPLNRLT